MKLVDGGANDQRMALSRWSEDRKNIVPYLIIVAAANLGTRGGNG